MERSVPGRWLGAPALAIIAVAADDPKTMSFPRMVGRFPFRRNHWALPNFDDQIANGKSGFFCHSHEVAMWPFRLMIVHHVGDLRK